jgi:hypothetical protein
MQPKSETPGDKSPLTAGAGLAPQAGPTDRHLAEDCARATLPAYPDPAAPAPQEADVRPTLIEK